MVPIFDRIANWVDLQPRPTERYVWVLNHKTSEITWMNRKLYSHWQWNETSSLQQIFNAMNAQLPASLVAQDKEQLNDLVALHRWTYLRHIRYADAPLTIFGRIYRYFFVNSPEIEYKNLKGKLDSVIAASIATVDTSTFSPKDFENLAKAQLRLPPDLGATPHIDWHTLTLDQFKAACQISASLPIKLSDLDKAKTTYLLEQDKTNINDFTVNDIELNAAKIEPRFFRHLENPKKDALDLSKLSAEQERYLFDDTNDQMPFFDSTTYAKNLFDYLFYGQGNPAFNHSSNFTFRFRFEGPHFSQPFGEYSKQVDEKIQQYRTNLKSAVERIRKNHKINADPTYENLRLKCLKNEEELADHPELIFVDDLTAYDPDKLRSYFLKIVRVFHPDKNGENLEEAQELFQIVSAAYEYLENKAESA